MQNLSRIEERIVKASVASLDWRGNLEPFARKKVRERVTVKSKLGRP